MMMLNNLKIRKMMMLQMKIKSKMIKKKKILIYLKGSKDHTYKIIPFNNLLENILENKESRIKFTLK